MLNHGKPEKITPEVIASFDSMADFYASIGGQLPQDTDFTVNRLENIHREVPYRSPRFRANYFSIVMITAGHGRYFINDDIYESRERMLHFTNPGHVKGFEILKPVSGFVITFGEAFLKQYVMPDVYSEFPYLLAEVAPPAYLDENSFSPFHRTAEEMLHEFTGSSVLKYKMIGSLMKLLLLRINESFWIDYDPQREAGGKTAIVQAFNRKLDLLAHEIAEGDVDEPLRVNQLAKHLHLHPNYLSTVIKRKTGKSVKTWISEKNLVVAKQLLSRSSMSLKQIAYRIGFSEPGHFTRFFKNIEGVSPSDYRRDVIT